LLVFSTRQLQRSAALVFLTCLDRAGGAGWRSYGEIVHELERRGIPTARGLEKWTRSGVRQVVQRAEREAER
jgi:hypothetical protein